MNKSATLPRIRITPEMKGRLKRLARDDQRTLSDYVRLVLRQHLRSVECFDELAGEQRTDGEFSTKAVYTDGAVWLEDKAGK